MSGGKNIPPRQNIFGHFSQGETEQRGLEKPDSKRNFALGGWGN